MDDHPVFRHGIRQLVNRMDDAEICGEAGDAPTALDAFRRLHPDLILLDIGLPGMNGIELIKMVKSEQNSMPVLVLSMHDEAIYGLGALRAGAKGYLRKDDALDHLNEALHTTAKNRYYLGRRFLSHVVREAIRCEDEKDNSHDIKGLTDREIEVFDLLGSGLGTRQIASKLGLSVKTIESHCARIKEKLLLHSAAQLVALAKDWRSERERETSSSDQAACNTEVPPKFN
ncbi:response regulator transcription factor [Phragmitibacter flavus]|uniref:response regulator transcription factor n=1 Tax=Phragmitibacter flavus TaxID=2576071 RepID=UPI00140CBA33|nr:response regulator transcription factor [Phragmitibacter flavus]